MRRAGYSKKQLDAWRADIEAQNWRQCFTFFKHEDEAAGPRAAETFARMFAGS